MIEKSRLAVAAGFVFALLVAVVGAVATTDADTARLLLEGSSAVYGVSPTVATGL